MDQKDYRLSAVMFTDIVGFSKMMEQDEAGTLDLLKYHNALVQRHTEECNGRVIKTIGDAFLVDFSNTLNAVKCAIRIQNELASYNLDRKVNPLLLRIGIHLGDIHFFENDALGDGINIASRLQSIAKPGRICISQDVYNLVYNKLSVPINSLGPVKLKNISRQIHGYEVLPEEVVKTEEQIKAQHTSSSFDVKDEIKKQVMDEIKLQGRRISVDEARACITHEGPEVHKILLELKQKGLIVSDVKTETKTASADPISVIKSNVSQIISDALSHVEETTSRAVRRGARRKKRKNSDFAVMYREYVADLERKVSQGRAGFVSHVVTYAGVMAGLGFLFDSVGVNFVLPIVGLGWGIGLVTHWYEQRQKKKELKAAKSKPAKNKEQFKLIKKLWRKIKSVGTQFLSTVTVSALLFYINLFVDGGGVMWAAIPSGIMAASFLARLPGYFSAKRELIQQIEDADRHTSTQSADPRITQARVAKDKIYRQLEELGDNNPFDEDIRPLVNDFVQQIEDLCRRESEMNQIISEIPMSSLDDDLSRLESKRALCDNPSILAEYDNSIKQIERQRHSFSDLIDQKEKVGLRIQNAVNSIKQMQIDLGRVRSFNNNTKGSSSIDDLKHRTSELNHYINDIDEIYRELDEGV